jgi:hypothetical protein
MCVSLIINLDQWTNHMKTVMSITQMDVTPNSHCHMLEFGLVIGFIVHLQMVTRSTYNTLANSCIRLLTAAHTMSTQFDFTSRLLVTNPNNVLCLRPSRLVNTSQLIPRLTAISHQPVTLLIDSNSYTSPAYNTSARTA